MIILTQRTRHREREVEEWTEGMWSGDLRAVSERHEVIARGGRMKKFRASAHCSGASAAPPFRKAVKKG